MTDWIRLMCVPLCVFKYYLGCNCCTFQEVEVYCNCKWKKKKNRKLHNCAVLALLLTNIFNYCHFCDAIVVSDSLCVCLTLKCVTRYQSTDFQ